jgi:hypothetical protein
MSPDKKYFIFSGHALGAAAHFHKLDDEPNLNHVIPALAPSVVAATGGLSKNHVANYYYAVDQPRKRTLVSVNRIDTMTSGTEQDGCWVTEVDAEVEGVRVLEKLDVGYVKLHFVSSRSMDSENCDAKISTKGSRIEGLRMGSMSANIFLDEEPLLFTASKDHLVDYYRGKDPAWRAANARRFSTDPAATEVHQANGRVKFSLVHKIELSGTQDPDHQVHVEEDNPYTIHWDGFGKIIVGEVFVKCCERRVTMLRLYMGSDGGGSGSLADGTSNGQIGP